jgi:hypothetical protein
MHADEGSDSDKDRENGRAKSGSGDRIGLGGGDDNVTRIQLAARWSETHGPEQGDSLAGILKRFRVAYEYLDAVIHGVEPPDLEPDRVEQRPSTVPAPPAPVAPPAYTQPSYTQPAPTPPESEPRPWG